jgi:hypothetical protein
MKLFVLYYFLSFEVYLHIHNQLFLLELRAIIIRAIPTMGKKDKKNKKNKMKEYKSIFLK